MISHLLVLVKSGIWKIGHNSRTINGISTKLGSETIYLDQRLYATNTNINHVKENKTAKS